jgi:prepilin-type N-terminal cleavage/methylation domain-containing protein
MPTNNRQSGFSLIEMLVVVALFAIISMAAVSLFFSTIVGSNSVDAQAVIKENGNYALDIMSYMIRNAQQITACSAGSLTILNRDGGSTQFYVAPTNQIASNSAARLLTTSNVRVDPAEIANPSFFTCTPAVNPTTVTIKFNIRKGNPATDNARDIVTQTFGTTVGLRRY